MHTEITSDTFKELGTSYSYPTFVGTVDGFDITITSEGADGAALHWYGRFCEAHNAPSHAHLVRNPNAWQKRDTGNGTDSWVRTSSRIYGWFAWELFTPSDEVQAHIRDGKSEREAWHLVNEMIRDTVQGLADGDIHEVIVTVTASRNGIELASESCGTECDSRNTREALHERIMETGLDCVAEALHHAKQALATLCACH